MARLIRTLGLTVALLIAACAARGVSTRTETTAMQAEALSVKQRRIVSIAAFTAIGDLQRLRVALAEGLDAGLTVNEIKEVLVQMYAYAGFPRSLNALNTLIAVLDTRKRSGVSDTIGREPNPPPAGKTSIEIGTDIQTKLLGSPTTGGVFAFSPTIDTFLKGHLFGDILARDNLDLPSREIATIAALATLEELKPQLASHLNAGLNVGLTEPQLRGIITVIDDAVGKARGDNARDVLAEVLRKRSAVAPSSAGSATAVSPPLEKISVRRRDALVVESAPPEHFSGSARVQRLFQANDPARASGASVTFDSGAHTAWHAHPLGQTLIVTEGTGWVQQWGEPAQAIETGDVVWIPPGIKHWHGATARTAMAHLAIQERLDGKTVEWMEAVGDEQYPK